MWLRVRSSTVLLTLLSSAQGNFPIQRVRQGSSLEKPGQQCRYWDPASRSCDNSSEMRLLQAVPSLRVLGGFEVCSVCPYIPLFLLSAAGRQIKYLGPKHGGRRQRGQVQSWAVGGVPWDLAPALCTSRSRGGMLGAGVLGVADKPASLP